MDLKDLEINQLVIEWLRYHIPRYIDKNMPIMVADEVDKIPAAISIRNAYIKEDELNIELTSNEIINLGSIVNYELIKKEIKLQLDNIKLEDKVKKENLKKDLYNYLKKVKMDLKDNIKVK